LGFQVNEDKICRICISIEKKPERIKQTLQGTGDEKENNIKVYLKGI
jgi:hypothetical protein